MQLSLGCHSPSCAFDMSDARGVLLSVRHGRKGNGQRGPQLHHSFGQFSEISGKPVHPQTCQFRPGVHQPTCHLREFHIVMVRRLATQMWHISCFRTQRTPHTPFSQSTLNRLAGGDGDAGGDADGQPHPGGAPLGGHGDAAGPPLPRRPVRPAAGAAPMEALGRPQSPGDAAACCDDRRAAVAIVYIGQAGRLTKHWFACCCQSLVQPRPMCCDSVVPVNRPAGD